MFIKAYAHNMRLNKDRELDRLSESGSEILVNTDDIKYASGLPYILKHLNILVFNTELQKRVEGLKAIKPRDEECFLIIDEDTYNSLQGAEIIGYPDNTRVEPMGCRLDCDYYEHDADEAPCSTCRRRYSDHYKTREERE